MSNRQVDHHVSRGGALVSRTGPGSVLHTVQMSRVFKDSKTFVDMTLRADHTPQAMEAAFQEVLKRLEEDRGAEGEDHHPIVADFVDEFFTLGDQMALHVPEDWTSRPHDLLDRIRDPNLASFALALNGIWKDLSRRIVPSVEARPELHTLIYLPHPIIIPGGRFREVYYWDTYWVVRGLLRCGMVGTVKGLLLNFAHLIRRFGFVPNGGRTYYLNRSQPPLFIQMVHQYFLATQDVEFLR